MNLFVMKQDIISYMFNVEDNRTKSMFIMHFGRHSYLIVPATCVPVWLSGRALRRQRKRLWVRFPGNTHTDEIV